MKMSSRASKRAPTWHSCMVAPNSLSAQPNPDLIERLAIKGFWSYHIAMSREGSFWSSWWARFHGALRNLWHSFCNLTDIWSLCSGGVEMLHRQGLRRISPLLEAVAGKSHERQHSRNNWRQEAQCNFWERCGPCYHQEELTTTLKSQRCAAKLEFSPSVMYQQHFCKK